MAHDSASHIQRASSDSSYRARHRRSESLRSGSRDPSHAVHRQRTVVGEAAAAREPDRFHELAWRFGLGIAAGQETFTNATASLAIIAGRLTGYGEGFDDMLIRLQDTMANAGMWDEREAEREIRKTLLPMLDRPTPLKELRAAAYRAASARLLRPACNAIVGAMIRERVVEIESEPVTNG